METTQEGKKRKRHVNIRQKKLANLISENVRGEPMTSLMAKAGYSTSYANASTRLKGTETWKELMEIYLPDDVVAAKHVELMNAEMLMTRNVYHKLTDEEIFALFNPRGYQVVDIKRFMNNCAVTYFAPDNTNRKGALELVNKVKGTYAPEKHAMFVTGLENMSDEDLDMALSDKSFILDRYKKYAKQEPAGEPTGFVPHQEIPRDKPDRSNTKQKELKTGDDKKRPSAGNAKRKVSGVAPRKARGVSAKPAKVAAKGNNPKVRGAN